MFCFWTSIYELTHDIHFLSFVAEIRSYFTLKQILHFFVLLNVNSHIIIFNGCVVFQCMARFYFLIIFFVNGLCVQWDFFCYVQ